jgi:mRNA-degrading endonuclease HigB of HigAB toxin-antitoxin module
MVLVLGQKEEALASSEVEYSHNLYRDNSSIRNLHANKYRRLAKIDYHIQYSKRNFD